MFELTIFNVLILKDLMLNVYLINVLLNFKANQILRINN